MSHMEHTEREAFLENMSRMYEEREAIFAKREAEYEKQRGTLAAMLNRIKADREALEQQESEQEKRQKELDEKEQMLQDWYNEEVQARKKLEERELAYEKAKESMTVTVRMELEQAKNEKIKAQQLREEYEHQLGLLGLLLEQQGKDGTKAKEFFSALLESGTPDASEDLQEQIAVLQKELEVSRKKTELLQAENSRLKGETAGFGDERKKLLALIAKMHQGEPETSGKKIMNEYAGQERVTSQPDALKDLNKTDNAVPNQRSRPHTMQESAAEPVEIQEEQEESEKNEKVFEELNASILQTYLERNEKRYTGSEIRHSDEGEQLHFSMGGLEYAFIFSAPARFEIAAKRKNSRTLQKLLERMNSRHPEVKFRYEAQDGKVYAIGYFTDQIPPYTLMEKVQSISDCFKQE